MPSQSRASGPDPVSLARMQDCAFFSGFTSQQKLPESEKASCAAAPRAVESNDLAGKVKSRFGTRDVRRDFNRNRGCR